MKIREFQNYIVERLNGVEALVQGGCKAFAEDTREVYDEANQHLAGGKLAIVVVTPEFERAGSGEPNGLPAEASLVIRCVECAPLSREDPTVIRALDAAEIVAHELDGELLEWKSIRQTSEERERALIATVTFGFDIILN